MGRLSADQAFSVAALWTIASTVTQQGVNAIVQDRLSTFSRHTAPRLEGGECCKVVTYRRLIAAGGTPATPSLASAAARDPHAKEEAVRVAKLDAFFQLVMEEVLDTADLGVTVDHLQDAGGLQSLKESVLAVPSRLSTERIAALMAALKRWKR